MPSSSAPDSTAPRPSIARRSHASSFVWMLADGAESSTPTRKRTLSLPSVALSAQSISSSLRSRALKYAEVTSSSKAITLPLSSSG